MHKALGKQGKKNVATTHCFKKECPVRKGYISEFFFLFFFFFTNQPSTDWLRSFVKQKGCKKKLCDQRMGVPLVYSPHLSFFDPQDEEVPSRKYLSPPLNTTNILTLNLSLKKCVCGEGRGVYKSNIGSFQKLFI